MLLGDNYSTRSRLKGVKCECAWVPSTASAQGHPCLLAFSPHPEPTCQEVLPVYPQNTPRLHGQHLPWATSTPRLDDYSRRLLISLPACAFGPPPPETSCPPPCRVVI